MFPNVMQKSWGQKDIHNGSKGVSLPQHFAMEEEVPWIVKLQVLRRYIWTRTNVFTSGEEKGSESKRGGPLISN